MNVIDLSYSSGKRDISINFSFSFLFNIAYFLVCFAIWYLAIQSAILICVVSTFSYVLAALPVIICLIVVDSYRVQ